MVSPWSTPPTRSDLRAAAGVLSALATGGGAADLLNLIADGPVSQIDAGAFVPSSLVQVTADYLLVAVSGTQNWLQWVCNFLGSNQTSNGNYPGRVNAYFSDACDALLGHLGSYLGALPSHRVVLLGHSLGGAIVQLLSSNLQGRAPRGILTICFGSPVVGNADYASAVENSPFLVQDTDDPFPSLPPAVWVGTGTPWTGFSGLVPATYVRSGEVLSLDADGTLSESDNTMSFTDAVSVVAKGQLTPHEISEYFRRLSLQDSPPLEGAKEPAELENQLDWAAANLGPGSPGESGGAGMLIQGIMYFKTNEQVAGWGESWIANTDITSMLAKLAAVAPIRANCLAGNIQIHAYKASNIDPTRTSNQSQSMLLDNPISGKAPGTNPADAASLGTNETVDAIDYECLSSANSSKRIFPFRGIPDGFVAASVRTPAGVAADKLFRNYFAAVKAQNLGYKVYTRGNPQTIIQNITKDAVTGNLLLTSPGHGLANRNLITIRRLKENPMVNGFWRVKVQDANSVLLVGSGKFDADATGSGTWQLYQPAFDSLESFAYNRISTRKTGRPFGQLHGKRSARLLHH